MNLEEGFRRIGIATYWVAILPGILAFFASGNLLFASLVGLAVIILFHIGVYVPKGFIKENERGKNKN